MVAEFAGFVSPVTNEIAESIEAAALVAPELDGMSPVTAQLERKPSLPRAGSSKR